MRGPCMCRQGVRETHRGWQWSCPLPRLAGGGSWPTAAGHPEARVQRHGSLATVHAVVPKSGGLGSTTLVTCSAPQPSVVPRRHAARCCGVQQQCRWRPHVPRPGVIESARRARTRSLRQRHAAAARMPSSRLVGGALAGRASQRASPRLCAKSGGCFRTSLVDRAGAYSTELTESSKTHVTCDRLAVAHARRAGPI